MSSSTTTNNNKNNKNASMSVNLDGEDQGASGVETTPAATVTASPGTATSTKKRSFMDRQEGATRVPWNSDEELDVTEPTPSKEPAAKKSRTMRPANDGESSASAHNTHARAPATASGPSLPVTGTAPRRAGGANTNFGRLSLKTLSERMDRIEAEHAEWRVTVSEHWAETGAILRAKAAEEAARND
ncbi:hypothetical protein LTR17_022035 [Elasticomyces elasticus]|nr:hypothetical protein LTR17_022035 [Elasticomyces elasticus]